MPRIDEKRLQELADKTIFARTNEFNDYVLRTIGRRIKATGRASAADQIALDNMRNISGDMAKIKKKLAETMKLNVADVEAILTQTVTEGVNSYKPLFDFKGAEFIPFEQNEYAKFLVNHWAQETCEKMINLSRTKALCFDKYNALGEVIGTTPLEGAFQQAIDEAVMAVSTGTTDFNTAMKKTVERLGGSGVRVDYGNNITRGLPGMVRSNLLYGAKQAAQAYDEYVGEQIGCDGFEVDYHPGPRPTHAFMGGVMFSYNGDVVIDGVKYEDGKEALERLKDYGCLHFKMDVILGVSEPRYNKEWLEQQKKKDTELIEYNGKPKTLNQWKQSARRLETAVREQRDIAFMAKESGIKSLENKANGKIADYRAAYDDLCDKVGIEKRYDRMATFPSKTVDKIGKNDIIKEDRNISSRNMANGLRKPPTHILSDKEIESLKMDIKAIGADENVFKFNIGRQTAYDEVLDEIRVRGDVLPDANSLHPRDLMSSRAVLAHEYYGHRAYRGTKLAKGSWNDEFRASYMAAKNTPNLTDEDRRYLVLDALERAKESGVSIRNNDFIRRILYGD